MKKSKARRGGSAPRRGRPPRSFLEAWGKQHALDTVTLTITFGHDDEGGPEAELDLFAEGPNAAVVLAGLCIPGIASERELAGVVVIDPPPALAGIATLAGGLGGADRLGAPPALAIEGLFPVSLEALAGAPEGDCLGATDAAAESAEACLASDDAEDDAERVDAAEDAHEDVEAAAPPPLAADADLDDLAAAEAAEGAEEPAAERTAYVPGFAFAVQRLRLELGEPRGDQIECLLHAEADAYAEDTEADEDAISDDVDEIDVPLVAILVATLVRESD